MELSCEAMKIQPKAFNFTTKSLYPTLHLTFLHPLEMAHVKPSLHSYRQARTFPKVLLKDKD